MKRYCQKYRRQEAKTESILLPGFIVAIKVVFEFPPRVSDTKAYAQNYESNSSPQSSHTDLWKRRTVSFELRNETKPVLLVDSL